MLKLVSQISLFAWVINSILLYLINFFFFFIFIGKWVSKIAQVIDLLLSSLWSLLFLSLVLILSVSFTVQDSEENDGSPGKPYYMSKDLMSILGKKNKI